MIKAGKFRRRWTLEKRNREADGQGGFQTPTGEDEWLPVAKVWLKVKPIGSRESFFAQQIAPTQTHEIRMRYRKGITQEMRFTRGTRILHILGKSITDEEKREIVIRAEENPAVAT